MKKSLIEHLNLISRTSALCEAYDAGVSGGSVGDSETNSFYEPLVCDLLDDSTRTPREKKQFDEIRKLQNEFDLSKFKDRKSDSTYIDINIKSIDCSKIDDLFEHYSVHRCGDDSTTMKLAELLQSNKLHTLSRILGSKYGVLAADCRLVLTACVANDTAHCIEPYKLFLKAMYDSVGADQKKEEDFSSYWDAQRISFWSKYSDSENIKHTKHGLWIKPIFLSEIKERASAVARSVNSCSAQSLIYNNFSITSTINFFHTTIVENDGMEWLCFDRMKMGTDPVRVIPLKAALLCFNHFLEWCTLSKLFDKHTNPNNNNPVVTAEQLFELKPNVFRTIANDSSVNNKRWFVSAVDKGLIDATEDESLLLDTMRILLCAIIQNMAKEQIEALNIAERDLRVAPLAISASLITGIVIVQGIFSYTIINRPLGQYPLFIYLLLSLCSIGFIWYVIYRNKMYERDKKVKNLQGWVFSVIGVIFCLAVSGSYIMARYDAYDSTYYYNRRADHTMVVAGLYNKKTNIIDFPDNYQDYSIVGIADNSFVNCTKIEKAKITSKCAYVGKNAFSGCKSLAEFYAVDSNAEYGAYVFKNCRNLSDVMLNGETQVISKGMFANCTKLGFLSGIDNVEIIQEKAFINCIVYDGSGIFDKVSRIGDQAFSNSSVTNPTFGSELCYVGKNSFLGCSKIDTITMEVEPELHISKNAFEKCVNLRELYLENNSLMLDSGAFKNCALLEKVTFVGNNLSFGRNVFNGCSSITRLSLDIEQELNFDISSFAGCKGLKDLYIANDSLLLKSNTFKNCTVLENVTLESSNLSLRKNVFKGCEQIKNISVPHLGKSLKRQKPITYAFSNAIKESLVSVYFNSSDYTCLAKNSFAGCVNLVDVDCVGTFTQIDKYAFKNCSSLSNIFSLDSITHIKSGAFYGCKSLTDISLDSIESIDYQAFTKSGLTSLYIDKDAKIGKMAFSDCKLSSVYINGENTVIGDRAFIRCDSLGDITIDTVKKIGKNAFENTACVNVSIPFVGSKYKDSKTISHAFGKARNNIQTLVVNQQTEFAKNAISDCKALQEVTLSEDTARLGKNMFKGCISLKSINELPLIAEVPDSAFENCKMLTSFSMLPNATVFEKECFAKSGITEPHFTNVHYIAKKAFYKSAITDVTISGEYETEIAYKAFIGCDLLSSVYITGENTVIGSRAFSNCRMLSNISIDAIRKIGKNAFEYTASENVSLPFVGSKDKDNKTIAYAFGKSKNNIQTLSIKQQTEFAANSLKNCVSLKEVSLSADTVSLGKNIFKGCVSLESVSELPFITEVPEAAFANCKTLSDLSMLPNATVFKKECFAGSGLTTLNLTNAQSIGKKAFFSTAITDLSISGEYATEISYMAFGSCKNLSSATIYSGCNYAKKVFHNSPVQNLELAFIGKNRDKNCTLKYIMGNSTKGLKSLVINDQSEFSSYAFKGATSLETLQIKKGIDSFSYGMFSKCKSLSLIDAEINAGKIPSYTFYKCDSLREITFELCDNIKPYAFARSGLKSLTIDSEVTTISSYAFYKCKDLEVVEMEEEGGNVKINSYAFSRCKNLKYVNLNQRLSKIGAKIFIYCDSLTDLSVPFVGKTVNKPRKITYLTNEKNTIENIAVSAQTDYVNGTFKNCKKLKTAQLGSAEQISKKMFSNCPNLLMVQAEEITDIPDYAFYKCNAFALNGLDQSIIQRVGDWSLAETDVSVLEMVNLTDIGNYAFSGCNSISSVNLSSQDINSIGKRAFQKCYNLKSFNMGDVSRLGKKIFDKCDSLSNLSVAYIGTAKKKMTMRTAFGSGSGSICELFISKQSDFLRGTFKKCESLTEINIAEEVTSIPANAFKNCGILQALYAPGVTDVAKNAFYGCKNLTYITLSPNVSSIGKRAFYKTNIAEFNFANVSYIGYKAFAKSYLSAVNIVGSDNGLVIKDRAFAKCDNLTQINISNNLASLGYRAFNGCKVENVTMPFLGKKRNRSGSLTRVFGLSSARKKIESIVLTDTIKLAYKAFANCPSLTTVILNDGIKKLPYKTFYNCGMLSEVVLGADLTTIGSSAFAECKSLQSISLPSTVSKIKTQAFYSCSALTSITLPDELTDLGAAAFRNCGALTEVYAKGITEIDDNTFRNCTALKNLYISEAVERIGLNSFSECYMLTIFYDSSFQNWEKIKKPFTFDNCEIELIDINGESHVIAEKGGLFGDFFG